MLYDKSNKIAFSSVISFEKIKQAIMINSLNQNKEQKRTKHVDTMCFKVVSSRWMLNFRRSSAVSSFAFLLNGIKSDTKEFAPLGEKDLPPPRSYETGAKTGSVIESIDLKGNINK